MEKNGAAGTGITFFGLLGIAFIVMKIIKVIDWPWWLVLAPLWGPWAFVLVFIVIYVIFRLVVAALTRR